MAAKKTASKQKPLSRTDARSAVRIVRKTAAGKKHPSKTWKKGGKEYSKVLGHFGLSANHAK